jgi:hypothetical protein
MEVEVSKEGDGFKKVRPAVWGRAGPRVTSLNCTLPPNNVQTASSPAAYPFSANPTLPTTLGQTAIIGGGAAAAAIAVFGIVANLPNPDLL